MNIQQLKYFDEVCRSGNLSKAAQNLYISQQGLSMSIQRLESEFSSRLFKRTKKGIVLTEEGEFLWEHAKKIIKESDTCEKYFENKGFKSRNVSVVSAYGVLSDFASARIQDFLRENPQIHVRVTEYIDREVDSAVENEDAEIGFSVGPVDISKFDAYALFKQKLCLVVNKLNPLSKREFITAEDLNNLPIITVNDHFKPPYIFMEKCKQYGVKPDIRFQVGEVVSVHRLVSSEPEFCGLTTESIARDIPSSVTVAIPFEDPELCWCVYLIKRKDIPLMPAAQTFANFLRNIYLKENR